MIVSDSVKIDPEQTHLSVEFKHDRPLTACYWEPKSRYIFFGAEDHAVHRLELSTNRVTHLSAHDSWVRALGSTTDGETLFTAGYDGRLVWWPAAAEKPEPMRVVEAHQGWVRALAVSPDGQRIATCGNDRLVKLWDVADGKLIQEYSGHNSHVYNVVFSPDAKTVVSCDLLGQVKAWDLEARDKSRDVVKAESLTKYDTTFRADIGGARCIAMRLDGLQLALGGITNVSNAFAGVGEIAVVLVDWIQSKIALQLEAKDKVRGTAWGLAYHPDGFWIGLSGGAGGGWLYFWKGDIALEYFRFKLKNDGRGMAMSPDNRQVAVAHADMHLRTYVLHAKQA